MKSPDNGYGIGKLMAEHALLEYGETLLQSLPGRFNTQGHGKEVPA